MNRKSYRLAAFLLCIAVLVPGSVTAETRTEPTWNELLSEHHRMQYQMMARMAEQMKSMTERMAQGGFSDEAMKQMSVEMKMMAGNMGFMSGLAARPAHTHAQLQKQMDDMRKQMKEMDKAPPGSRK